MESIRYLALGDSYTIGTGLDSEAQNFPSLLARRIQEETGIDVALVNLGVNGYTTADLIREELPVARTARPELVTVLIGANDVVQGSDEATYRAKLAQIYEAVNALGVPVERVLAISIPDFSPLPSAAPFGSSTHLRARIDTFNDIARAEAASRGFLYADITRISREEHGGEWLAPDGLHPGPAQHRAFADHLWKTAKGWGSVGLDRWSKPARQVLKRAEEEANVLHHRYIGTEHLLLGLLRDAEGDGGKLLSAWHVSYQRVRKLIDGVLRRQKKEAAVPSAIIPTTRVRKVLRIASLEASNAGAQAVGTEHVLLAISVEGEGIAAHVLRDVGATPALIRTAISQLNENAAVVSRPRRGPWSRLIARLQGRP